MKHRVPVTIDDLEETARQEADYSTNYRIAGKWLHVMLNAANGPLDECFKYLYNGKQITRDAAVKLLEA